MTHTKQHYLDAFEKEFMSDGELLLPCNDIDDASDIKAFISQMYDELVSATKDECNCPCKECQFAQHLTEEDLLPYRSQGKTEDCSNCKCHCNESYHTCFMSHSLECSHCRKEQSTGVR